MSKKKNKDFENLKVQIGGSHYINLNIQPIEYIQANKLDFCEGNVVKYITRYSQKGGVEDLQKCRHYVDLLIEFFESNDSDNTPD